MLDIKDVYKSYKGKDVLKGVTFRVNKGEIKGLIGVNGAGKTSIYKSIYYTENKDEKRKNTFFKGYHSIKKQHYQEKV